ncbi:GDSL esterase/lipase At5g55050-like [Musa acuminata AAA Group]|uniref:GDSL esterase/lipase At5g55050-like n=1 Tax=Musa acuminata AAA Group TaxID=214697 RepID=UPI0031E23892
MKLAVPLLLLSVISTALFAVSAALTKVPAVYVFGDSTADVGNNNYLSGTDAKADFPHYGVDFPHQTPTGRFSNGYNTIDFLAIHMGFKRSPPPYLAVVNKPHPLILRGRRGVSFASGGSGILDSTGTTITMTKQIQDFAAHESNIASRVTAAVAKGLLSKSVFLISSGGNDVFAFFFATGGNATADQTEQFYNVMITNYTTHLKALYDLGARKFALINVPPVGCCPISRVMHPLGACLDGLNALTKGFNDRVSVLVKNLSSEMEGMKYTVGNSYNVVMDIVSDPAGVGYKDVSSACCGSGKLGAEVMCSPNTTFCTNRNEFLFWDRIHPTQETSEKAGFALYGGASEYASPINLKQLVES